MRPRGIAAGALGVAVAAAGVVAAVSAGSADDGHVVAASQSSATTQISVRDLVETDTVDGKLGYSDGRPVVNRLSGTMTWTPKVGSVVKTNQRLFEVDGRAVYLLDGVYPAYRDLRGGRKGDDVRQLERNLRELGLDPGRDMRVDGTWDAGTTAAVKRWQKRKGMDQDGSIAKGRIVFQPGSRRISKIEQAVGTNAAPGSSAQGSRAPASTSTARPTTTFVSATVPAETTAPTPPAPAPGTSAAAQTDQDVAVTVMTTTSPKRIVTIDLETMDIALAEQGAQVSVEMPAGDTVKGTIVRIGKVATRDEAAQNDNPPTTIKIIVKLHESVGTGLDQAPVDVRLQRSKTKDALAIPVTALLALQGGTFAVEVREGTTRRVVAVQTGVYTDGYVQITGDGLRTGMRVTDARV